MIVDLKDVKFENDMFFVALPEGGNMILNLIDETVLSKDKQPVRVNRINIQLAIEVYDEEQSEVLYSDCSSIIGLQDSVTKITTDYKEYLGEVLTAENMKFCKVVVNE